eukprot:gene39742-53732_t
MVALRQWGERWETSTPAMASRASRRLAIGVARQAGKAARAVRRLADDRLVGRVQHIETAGAGDALAADGHGVGGCLAGHGSLPVRWRQIAPMTRESCATHGGSAMTYRLYGTPGSLYTAKARSWLIKNGVPFENRAAGEPCFRGEIVPKIGRWIIPVLESGDGELIQDGSAIIERLEADGLARWPTFPQTPRHRLIGQIFELFGGEGMLRPAMHYRWNFDAVNQPFVGLDFAAGLATPGADPSEGAAVFQFAAQRMRKAMSSFGVSEASIPLVEASYEQFLALFDAHLAHSPYLLGGRPTIGDYGLIAPLYAHLGRDPHPADLMKRKAHRVWRWVERMNAADLDSGEYGYPAPDLFPDDGVPDTLKALLRFVAEDYLPEVRALSAHVGPIGEEGDAAEPFRLALGAEIAARGVEPHQLGIAIGRDLDLGLDDMRIAADRDDQRLVLD